MTAGQNGICICSTFGEYNDRKFPWVTKPCLDCAVFLLWKTWKIGEGKMNVFLIITADSEQSFNFLNKGINL